MENIDIDNEILENIDIDKKILENIDIDKILNRLEFGISNRARLLPQMLKKCPPSKCFTPTTNTTNIVAVSCCPQCQWWSQH